MSNDQLIMAVVSIGASLALGLLAYLFKRAVDGIDTRITAQANFAGKAIDELWEHVKGLAPDTELQRVRLVQRDIFAKIDAHDKEDRDRHEEVIKGIARLEGKLDALLTRKRVSD